MAQTSSSLHAPWSANGLLIFTTCKNSVFELPAELKLELIAQIVMTKTKASLTI